MSFLTPALLAGAALVALPIVLHLVMRQEPQRLVFPAMRFIQQRRATNQTRMRLRHWLLLALRCAAIGLLAVALARPVLRPPGGAATGSSVLAAAMVIDNGPRMGYRHDNQTRLEVARERAAWLLGQLPADTRVAVVDRGGGGSRRLGDRDGALLRVERITETAAAGPLSEAIAGALRLLAETEDARREAYVFTDLAVAAWTEADRVRVADALDGLPGVRVHLVDVGVARPVNQGLGAVTLSSDSPRVGQAITVRAPVYATDAVRDEPRTVEFWLSEGDAPPRKRAETLLEPTDAGAPGAEGVAEFTLAALDEGVHQGYVRLLGGDPLAVDDTRHLTIGVEPARPLLVASANDEAALFVREAIAPSAAGAAPRQPLAFRRFDQLADARLEDHAAVMLLDPPGLDDNLWRRLSAYARGGGSVAVCLGSNASRQTHNAAAPQTLLPGPLQRRSRLETYFRPTSYRHGALSQMAAFAEQVPWARFPVFEHWEFESLAGDAVVVAPMASGTPALIEQRRGDGRVVTMTTPVSDPAQGPRGRGRPWNLLPTGDDPWPFVLLMGNLADYLAGSADTRRNFAAGEAASVPVPAEAAAAGFVLRLPSGEATRQPPPTGRNEAVVGVTEQVGSYRLLAGGAAGRLDTGFSVNAAPDVGRLERLDFDALAADLGPQRIRLARTEDELARGIEETRVGREGYPLLICLVAAALAAEQWVANRFYRGAAA